MNKKCETLIVIEGQTCLSAFAGLQVLYLNLTLASWLFRPVPYLLVSVVVGRRRLLSLV